MANSPRESTVEAAIIAHAKKIGAYTRKFSSPARRGVPDRIFIKNGVVLFLEIKRPGNKPTALQEHEIAEIRKVGGNAEWVDNTQQGRALLDIYFHPNL